MKNQRTLKMRQVIVLVLTLCLSVPLPAFAGGKDAKKHFKEGMKFEVAQQWDLAAQEFALAVAADPGNAEYRLHFHRSMQNASIMFTSRGDQLAQQNDYASAYNAYRQAYGYDQTNEVTRVKMERMLELQKAQMLGAEPAKYNAIGNYKPERATLEVEQKPRASDVNQVVSYRSNFKPVLNSMAQSLGLNVILDETVKDSPIALQLNNTSMAQAMDNLFLMTKNTFEVIGRRTIFVYPDNPQNRQKFERLYVKNFYLGNAKLDDVRNVLSQVLPTANKMIATSPQNNTIIVRASLSDLRVAQEIIETLDKNRPEVVLEVEIYEVSANTALQIGNQLATSASNFSVGGTTTTNGGTTTTTGARTGTTTGLSALGGFVGDVGASIASGLPAARIANFATLALPPSTLSLLQSKNNSRSIGRTIIHALDGEANETKVGEKIPVQLGTALPSVSSVPGTGTGANQGFNSFGGFGGLGYSSIQYQDVGLVIKATPTITNDGYVQVKMEITSSNTQPGGSTPEERLTPRFTQRSLTTIARILDGKTSVVAGIQQQNKGDGRSSIPIIGMVPILGRLFTTPSQTSTDSDIVITVTPHIVRSSQIEKRDYLAKAVGVMTGGSTLSVEEVIQRAQNEDDEERRLIAGQRAMPTAPYQSASQPVNDAALLQPNITAPTAAPTPRYNNNPDVQVIPTSASPAAASVPSTTGLTPPPRIGSPSAGLPAGPAGHSMAPTPTPTPAAAPLRNTPQPQAAVTSAPAAQRTGGGISGASGSGAQQPQPREGGVPEEQMEFVPDNPTEPVPQAVPVAVKRSPEVEKKLREQIEKRQAEIEKERKEQKAQPLPLPPNESPGKPVAPAAIVPVKPVEKEKPASDKPKNQQQSSAVPAASDLQVVDLNLVPGDIKTQKGKSFIVVMSMDGSSTMTGAQISLKYDPAMLQVKSVRDGGLLGKQPDMTHQIDGGNLLISLQQSGGKTPAKTSGRLLVVEFTALNSGQTAIQVNDAESQLTSGNVASARVASRAAQVSITAESAAILPGKE
jgi:general secretion pathway protein D